MWNRTQDTIIREAQYKGVFYFLNFYNKKKTKLRFQKLSRKILHITLINKIRANYFNFESLAKKNYIQYANTEVSARVLST